MKDSRVFTIREEIYTKFFSLGGGDTDLHWDHRGENGKYRKSLLFIFTYVNMQELKPHVKQY